MRLLTEAGYRALCAKGARWLVEQLPDSRLVELPGCGHYPMLEAADTFDAALLEFLVS